MKGGMGILERTLKSLYSGTKGWGFGRVLVLHKKVQVCGLVWIRDNLI
jgi:hypothetical protein